MNNLPLPPFGVPLNPVVPSVNVYNNLQDEYIVMIVDEYGTPRVVNFDKLQTAAGIAKIEAGYLNDIPVFFNIQPNAEALVAPLERVAPREKEETLPEA